MACVPRQERVCDTDQNCAGTDAPTVCVNKQCAPKICDVGESRSCFTGGDERKGVGTCREGLQFCVTSGSAWSDCVGEVGPVKEICDGLDNNCDGQTDEGLDCKCTPGTQRACYPGNADDKLSSPAVPTSCQQGMQTCTKDGSWGGCLGYILPYQQLRDSVAKADTDAVKKAYEACFDTDRNCDGKLDADLAARCPCEPGATRACYLGPPATLGKGHCQAGQQQCNKDGVWGFCLAQALPRAEEAFECNGIDDDCDGMIDNQTGTSVPLWRLCKETGPGGCAKIQVCYNKSWGPCLHREICGNGIDDDCDGKLDETDGSPGCCQPTEICGNQIDDNCDGDVDEADCQNP